MMPSIPGSGVTRRQAFQLSGTALLPPALALPPSPARANATDVLDEFLRMRGFVDERLVVGGLSGRYAGVVDGAPTPLFGVVSAVFSRARRHPTGGWHIVEYEQAYFTSLTTDEAMRTWRNPLISEKVAVPIASQSRREMTLGLDLRFDHPPVTGGVSVDHHVEGPEVFGGDVFFIEQTQALVPASDGRPPFRYSEATTLRTRLDDLRAPDKPCGCETAFDALVSWRPWMKMGERPGHLMAFGHGRYGVDVLSLPPAWIAATRIEKPDLLLRPHTVV